MSTSHKTAGVLILGIGNVLMGDEGVGVHVVERLQEAKAVSREHASASVSS